jgi:hypothetical protein
VNYRPNDQFKIPNQNNNQYDPQYNNQNNRANYGNQPYSQPSGQVNTNNGIGNRYDANSQGILNSGSSST